MGLSYSYRLATYQCRNTTTILLKHLLTLKPASTSMCLHDCSFNIFMCVHFILPYYLIILASNVSVFISTNCCIVLSLVIMALPAYCWFAIVHIIITPLSSTTSSVVFCVNYEIYLYLISTKKCPRQDNSKPGTSAYV